MKPVAWIKVRELAYMKAVIEHGKEDWQTNLGLKPEPGDEGLFTETQVQQLRESFEQSITDPENQPSQYGTVPLDWHLRDEALLQQALHLIETMPVKHPDQIGPRDALCAAIREHLKENK